MARAAFDPEELHPDKASLINNITTSSKETAQSGAEFMLPLCWWVEERVKDGGGVGGVHAAAAVLVGYQGRWKGRDAWMHGCMDAWMDAWMHGCMDAWRSEGGGAFGG